jgi:hypothetical protein
MLSKTIHTVPLSIIDNAIEEMPLVDFKMPLNAPSGNFFYDPWHIRPEFVGSIWETILNTLPFDLGEARIIKLEPGNSYLSHADIDDRWHLSLTGNRSYLIDLDSHKVHLLKKDGIWYKMNAGKLHTASNFGQIPRYQLVVRKLLKNSCLTNVKLVKIEPAYPQFDYRYTFDNTISPWLNYAAKQHYLLNFSVNESTVQFHLLESQISSLNGILTNNFKVTYE